MVLWAHLKKICLLLKLQVTLINHLGTWQGVQVSQLLRCSVVLSLLRGGYKLELWNWILKSGIKSDLKSRIKSD